MELKQGNPSSVLFLKTPPFRSEWSGWLSQFFTLKESIIFKGFINIGSTQIAKNIGGGKIPKLYFLIFQLKIEFLIDRWIYRWMDREVVVHIHNEILLSDKEEHIWVSSKEVDEPRTYYTKWSQKKKKIKKYHVLMYVYGI